jgi:hypothetical protein
MELESREVFLDCCSICSQYDAVDNMSACVCVCVCVGANHESNKNNLVTLQVRLRQLEKKFDKQARRRRFFCLGKKCQIVRHQGKALSNRFQIGYMLELPSGT